MSPGEELLLEFKTYFKNKIKLKKKKKRKKKKTYIGNNHDR